MNHPEWNPLMATDFTTYGESTMPGHLMMGMFLNRDFRLEANLERNREMLGGRHVRCEYCRSLYNACPNPKCPNCGASSYGIVKP